jgi:16S rRNA (guanine(966)-N(2))-methyltransferase RsmD
MMEKVRAAIFDMVQSQAGTVGGLPQGCRWLDLFAGTGSVGLEALSRGAGEAHFVELDPWVHRRVLGRNIEACGFTRASTCHTSRAEDFLKRAAAAPRFAGGPFDFISVCPPYLLVSYPELYQLLEASGLMHAGSIVFVEYPKQLAEHVTPTLGPLVKVRDRKYGRTWIAVYAPAGDGAGAVQGMGADGEIDPFLDP